MAKDLFPSPHPLTPPHSEEDLVSWLRLLRSRRVGPSTFYRLMGEHGSAVACLEALPDVALAAGVKDYDICSENAIEAELKAGKLAGAKLVAIGTTDYPETLAEVSDAPPLIWVMGNPRVLSLPLVGMVGARNASSLGSRMAHQLATELSQAGFHVVSGLARGIDTAAHMGSVKSGTVAVMAGGVDVVYPAENVSLAQEILTTGVRISEQPMGLQPRARHFPQRNRLISGVAKALVVVEAAAKSGSLITARNALDQGRDVLAVPGHPFDPRATGCNNLIRDGAALVRSASDITDVIKAIGPTTRPQSETLVEPDQKCARGKPSSGAISPDHILARLSATPIAEDIVINDIGATPQEFAAAIIDLELTGQVERQPGGMLCRVG